MTRRPEISIITIVYNDRAGLELTAHSIVSQSKFELTEWIIIDADSKDGTKDVIENYKANTSYAISEPDKGRYDGMNKGIALAKGEYTIFMNAGDSFNDNYVIENIIKESSWGNVDYISGNTYGVTDNRITGKQISPSHITATYFLKDTLNHQSTFIRTERLKKYGGYDCEYKIAADSKFFFEDIILRDATYAKSNLFIARYDVTGISGMNPTSVQQEKKRYISTHLPPRIVDDLNRLAFGKTGLERISSRLEHKGLLYLTISAFATLLYSPIAIKNRLLIHLRKHNL